MRYCASTLGVVAVGALSKMYKSHKNHVGVDMRRKWWAAVAAAAVVAVVPWLDFAISVADRPIRIRTVIAHRGNGFGKPENTVAAIEAAAKNGFPVEVDVQLSRDNIPHLLHDSTLDRTTSCTGLIADTDAADLALCGVDTLADAIATGATLELDLKVFDAAMITAIKKTMADAKIPPERIIIYASTKSTTVVDTIAAEFSDNVIMWSVEDTAQAKTVWKRFERAKDMYAVDVHTLWANPTLMRWITSRTKQLNVYHATRRWMLAGMPVTHVEVDSPLTFESTNPSPAMPELVYRASAVGLIVALAVGWALRGWAKPQAAYNLIKM